MLLRQPERGEELLNSKTDVSRSYLVSIDRRQEVMLYFCFMDKYK